MATQVAPPETAFASLARWIEEARDREHVPGVAVGIVLGDREWTAGSGFTSVEHSVPVDVDTLFQIGSTTKTMTATVAMRLVEQGLLELDAPVRRYLPDFRLANEIVARRVTLRHLLTHTGGWEGDVFDDTGEGDDALARYVALLAELPQIAPLGFAFSYCNSGFAVLGRVIEAVSGRPYEQAARELLLGPLGMERSFFFPAEVLTHRFAVGHVLRQARPVVARPWQIPRSSAAVGRVVSTTRDMLRYARFQLGDGAVPGGERLLRPETVAEMRRPLAERAAGQWCGLSWMLWSVDGIEVVAHGGATNGQLSQFLLVPSHGFGLSVMTNASGTLFGYEVMKRALAELLGLEVRPPETVTRSADELREYAGRYLARGTNVEVRLVGDEVTVTVTFNSLPPFERPDDPPPMRAAATADGELLVLEGLYKESRLTFVRDASGAIAYLRVGGRLHCRQ